jgi:hypothetical protein
LLATGALGYFAFRGDVGLRDDIRFFRFIWHIRLLAHVPPHGLLARRVAAGRSFHDRWGRLDGGQARASHCYRHRLYPQ